MEDLRKVNLESLLAMDSTKAAEYLKTNNVNLNAAQITQLQSKLKEKTNPTARENKLTVYDFLKEKFESNPEYLGKTN